MRRTIGFLVTLVLVVPFDGSAQASLSTGDRVRVRQVDGTTLVGTFTSVSPQAIHLLVGSDESMAEVPLTQVESLEASLGRRGNGLVTLAVTAALGATIGGLAWEPCSFLCFSPFSSENRSDAVLAGLGIGALVGLPIALLLRSERWGPVAVPGSAESAVSILPALGSTVGFVGSIRVGAF